ncbi:AGC protein kinase [Aphelenchoides fujianensis]|nr:AGC protein kinase [Aphelenchoides fujianensis]
MGNTNQPPSASSEPTTSATPDDDFVSPPPRKRARRIRKSFSLRSLASYASGRFSSRSRQSKEEDDEAKGRKRKHTDIQSISSSPSTTSASLLSIEKYWPALVETAFEPQFGWRADICESDFIILNCVGSGRFGNVFRAMPRNSPQTQVAVKIQDKVRIVKAGAEDQIKNEVYVQKLLGKHRFVAELFDCWQTSRDLFSVMEYVDGYGDLFTLWSNYGEFSEELIRLYAAEIAFALEYLHQRQVIHRDIKMENISVDASLHCKLVDFGYAKELQLQQQARTICGTLQYLAPEVARGQAYGFAVDWWSFGVLLFIMRTGQYPFPNGNAITHEELTFEAHTYPESCTQEFQLLINRLLVLDPTQRLSTTADLPFFENVNIEGIYNKDVPPWEILKSEAKYSESKRFVDPFSFPNDF